jgi:ATP-dependent DNA helicase RecQ
VDPIGDEALGHLKLLTGQPDADFRPGQLEAIRALVEERRRVLVVQRTGWGKSAVYFIATKMLRDRGFGPSILISPLLALMDNQVDAAVRMGVRAATVNSTNVAAWDELRARLQADEIDLLLVSEQRLNNDRFRNEWLPELGNRVGMLVVDEVHCISDWGHDFRPHYRRIGRFIQRLPGNVPVIGCTATASDRVVADVEDQLGQDITTVRGPLRRDGLRLEVHTDKRRPDARLAWMATNIPDLPGTGIVYCLTRRDVFNVAEFLREHGIECGTYMGGGDEADVEGKAQLLERFLANDLKCVVATSALGMGYDKPDVAFVIHYQMPSSAIAYYQQVGRAGRTLPESYAILLAGTEDRDIQDWFITQAFPSPEVVESVLEVLDDADGGVRQGQIAARANIASRRLENLLVQLEVDGAVTKEPDGWQRTMLPWAYPRERVDQVNDWKRTEQAAMAEYLDLDGCRMAFLQHQLDDPPTGPCGVCDNCTGHRFGRDPDDAVIGEAGERLRPVPIEIEPRKQWPSGLDEVSGRIPVDERAESGWCLARWDDATWGELTRIGKQETGRFDTGLLDALTALVQLRTAESPSQWITYVPSLRHPELVADLAVRLGERLSLPVHAVISKTRETEPQKEMQNSHLQVRNIWGAFDISGPHPSGPCLLVDDIIDSKWTTTIISVLLRRSGVEAVTPIALAYAGQSDT